MGCSAKETEMDLQASTPVFALVCVLANKVICKVCCSHTTIPTYFSLLYRPSLTVVSLVNILNHEWQQHKPEHPSDTTAPRAHWHHRLGVPSFLHLDRWSTPSDTAAAAETEPAVAVPPSPPAEAPEVLADHSPPRPTQATPASHASLYWDEVRSHVLHHRYPQASTPLSTSQMSEIADIFAQVRDLLHGKGWPSSHLTSKTDCRDGLALSFQERSTPFRVPGGTDMDEALARRRYLRSLAHSPSEQLADSIAPTPAHSRSPTSFRASRYRQKRSNTIHLGATDHHHAAPALKTIAEDPRSDSATSSLVRATSTPVKSRTHRSTSTSTQPASMLHHPASVFSEDHMFVSPQSSSGTSLTRALPMADGQQDRKTDSTVGNGHKQSQSSLASSHHDLTRPAPAARMADEHSQGFDRQGAGEQVSFV